jgi:transcription-repair coupling factor (superfamily II helicase)
VPVYPQHYLGVQGPGSAWLITQHLERNPKILVVANDRKSSEALASDLSTLQKQLPVNHFSSWETLPYEEVSPQLTTSAARIEILHRAQKPEQSLIVTSVEGLVHRVPAPWFIEQLTITVTPGAIIEREQFIQALFLAGFHHAPLVEQIGDIAVRGQIIDIFPAGYQEPIRIAFKESQISELRTFNAVTQRSSKKIAQVLILPVSEMIQLDQLSPFNTKLLGALALLKERAQLLGTPPSEVQRIVKALEHGTSIPGIELSQAICFPELYSLLDYCHPDTTIILADASAIEQQCEEIEKSYQEHGEIRAAEHYLVPDSSALIQSAEVTSARLKLFHQITFNNLDVSVKKNRTLGAVHRVKSASNIEVATKLRTRIGTGNAFQPLEEFINLMRRKDYTIGFFVGSDTRATRLQRLLLDYNLDAVAMEISAVEWRERGFKPPLAIFRGHISEGIRLTDEKIIFLSETELFGERSYREKSAHNQQLTRRLLNTLAQLKEGDYVVHTDYGIGLYQGIQHLDLDDVVGDFLQIQYLDSRLYLPVHNISKIQKYSAGEGQKPKLDKLASLRWKNTKAQVRQSVISIAGELIKLYAARSITRGWRFEPYGAEDDRFADGFAFNETPDQLKAIEETLADMALDRPMDRLICGDVGFGKTEVALRAAFKCTQHARQVAVLVPTTILVEQHRSNFEKRFRDFPVKVGAVSRFYSQKKNHATLADLALGNIDIIIGTHRLLQKDVIFKDIGLIIVDEEHRFGVKQKERLKQIRKQVDVLTLTATPIPRTLHMSLLGIRDASIITTPPNDRRVIRTYVASYSDSLVRDAIMREINRGGQTFYLHNRVQSIEAVCARLTELVPEARFGFAHGQMSEDLLEKIMLSFLNHEIDVLISTTIIESGLDVPNANTMIVERADALGLAQLYQIRGRVGRSTRQAYAYLLVPKHEKLSGEARQRLTVLQSLDDLGIGFQLALRDLEIRGAGNLLGKEQSGSVAAIGFELYTKILKEAVLHLKGEDVEIEEELDPEISINMSAYIPEDYIPDISERLVLYQRLSSVVNTDDCRDIEEELRDRFGNFSTEVQNLIELMKLKAVLKSLGVIKLELKSDRILLSLLARAKLNGEKVAAAMLKNPEKIKLSKNNVLTVRYDEQKFYSPVDLEAFTSHLFEQLQ